MAPMMKPVAITAWQCQSVAGGGNAALLNALRENRCLLAPPEFISLPFPTVVGEAPDPMPAITPALKDFDCRNARYALAALEANGFRSVIANARERYGVSRVGVVMGTSTSGIYDSEQAYMHFVRYGRMPEDFNFLRRHAVQATAEYLQKELALEGPCYAVSTACSSSAKALGSAQRMIQTGVCDAALVAGVDTLCRLTLRGFHALDLVSPDPCRPMDAERCGINIGEGSAMLLLEKASHGNRDFPHLLAVGESSDAHHMSTPDPEGTGAEAAMRQSLAMANIAPESIDYVNLHATATRLNDLAEAKAIHRLFGDRVPCSGIKGLLGHTLGASGAVEVVATLVSMLAGFLPGTYGLETPDPEVKLQLLSKPEKNDRVAFALCNAFGFGGSNASVLLAHSGMALEFP
ncbi:MAG: 3-ketoacyl-ACP synthase [Methylothermaceae bacteria B42]|nr:MAG: 3-ketoacyl-ACP synthase [Methylothermaceae bacteria B42]HHJ40380.1 beta-ketoacyl-ACP synthase [Methylothermaceae bacterium]